MGDALKTPLISTPGKSILEKIQDGLKILHNSDARKPIYLFVREYGEVYRRFCGADTACQECSPDASQSFAPSPNLLLSDVWRGKRGASPKMQMSCSR